MEYFVFIFLYKLTCKECAKDNIVSSYIGETIKPFKYRLNEHCKQLDINDCINPITMTTQSQPAIHASTKHANNNAEIWDVLILGREHNTQKVL